MSIAATAAALTGPTTVRISFDYRNCGLTAEPPQLRGLSTAAVVALENAATAVALESAATAAAFAAAVRNCGLPTAAFLFTHLFRVAIIINK